jgi:cyanophycin synthetase
MIRIHNEKTYYGPSPWGVAPVIVADLALEDARDEERGALNEGCRLLKSAYPDWFPSESLHKQSSVAEVAETVVLWSLGALNEVRGCLHEAGTRAEGDGSRIWLGFHHPKVSRLALELGVRSIEHAARSGELDRLAIDKGLAGLWKHCEMHHPDFQARILMASARERDIPVMPYIPGSRYWQYGWGSCSQIFFESVSNGDGTLGYLLQSSKLLSKSIFSELGYPTPKCRLVSRAEELGAAAEAIGWPCVVKPVSSGSGRGVTAGLQNMEDLAAAFEHARQFTSEAVMVEEHVRGDDHRLMVIEGKLYAAILREPSALTGDGTRKVAELLAEVNRFRTVNLVRSRYLRPIASDGVLREHLGRQGVDLETVPEAGRRITLRSNANLSTGGVCHDVTEKVHPEVRMMAEALAKAMGLRAAGIDYLTMDIGMPWYAGGALIEINATPSMDVMIAAGQDPLAVGGAMLGTGPGRVPVELVVVGTELLEEVQQRLEKEAAEGTGWSCGDRAGVGGMQLEVASAHPWSGVKAVLHHREVERVLVACSPAELVRYGMPVDRVDRTVLCGVVEELPEAWLQTLRGRSGSVEQVPALRSELLSGVMPG